MYLFCASNTIHDSVIFVYDWSLKIAKPESGSDGNETIQTSDDATEVCMNSKNHRQS